MIITLLLAAQFCATLRPSIQILVKAPLTIKSADDATTDQLHAGEAVDVMKDVHGGHRAALIPTVNEFAPKPVRPYK